jgi:cellobiose phosphorylase
LDEREYWGYAMQVNNYQDFGCFSGDGREFVFRRLDPPRPWLNYVWGARWVSVIDQRGQGTAWRRDAQGNVTRVLADRRVVIKDLDSGAFWHVGWDAGRDQEGYGCAHGLGYTRLNRTRDGITATWELTADPEADVELWRVRVTHDGSVPRRLAVYPCVEFDLEGNYYGTVENYLTSAFAHNTLVGKVSYYERMDQWKNGFFGVDREPLSFETRKVKLIGNVYNTWEAPEGVQSDRLSNALGSSEVLVGAFQLEANLEAGLVWEASLMAGACHEVGDIVPLRERFLVPGAFDAALAGWAQRPAMVRMDLELPDPYLTSFFNTWLKHALFLIAAHARGGFRGYRDSLQDAHGACAHDPDRARTTLIEAARRQRQDGSCLRGWGPVDDHLYSDSGVWYAATLNAYLKETGDAALLDEVAPFLDSGEATIWEHAVRAQRWIYADPGPHGLTRIRFGDWNDSFTYGRGGEGESVWLSMAWLWAHRELCDVAEQFGRENDVAVFRDWAQRLAAAIDEHGWEGDRYLAGYADDGSPVCSGRDDEASLYLLCQNWPVLAGLRPDRWAALDALTRRELSSDFGYVLMAPPLTHYRAGLGRISCLPPGWGENGSCYCHGSAFKAVADCLRGDGDAALETVTRLLPCNPKLPIEQSGLEPYTVTNMFCGPDHTRPGSTFKGWTTGTVPWLMRCVFEHMVGVRAGYDGLVIDPVMPSDWPTVRLVRRFRDATYTIGIENRCRGCGDRRVTIVVDGEALDGHTIPYAQYAGEHQVTVTVE